MEYDNEGKVVSLEEYHKKFGKDNVCRVTSFEVISPEIVSLHDIERSLKVLSCVLSPPSPASLKDRPLEQKVIHLAFDIEQLIALKKVL